MKLFKCGKTLDGKGQNWWDIAASFIDKEFRYIGPERAYYNGYIYSFGFWFFHVSLMVVTEG